MASRSKLANGGHAFPLGTTEHEINRFAEVGNKVADAAGEIIRKYFRKKFDILDKDDLSKLSAKVWVLFGFEAVFLRFFDCLFGWQ